MTSEQFYLIDNYIMSLKLPTDPLISRIINVQIKLALKIMKQEPANISPAPLEEWNKFKYIGIWINQTNCGV